MASYQDGSPLEFCHGHKREQSQDSGAYIDWNSEDSASPVGNPENNLNEEFVTVVAVENGGGQAKKDATSSFVTILAIGEQEDEAGKSPQNDKEEEVLVYRLPGERLGFGLKFEGGTNTAENVKRLFIQSSAPDSPASRAKCSWGSLVEGDEILKIDGHLVNNMTRLDCVRCLKESSVVIKLYVRHKSQKASQQPSRIKVENAGEVRVNNASSSPMVVSAEMKKTIPPPPPVPPRKITRKSPVPASKEEPAMVGPPEGFCDFQNSHNPVPKARNIQVADETSKSASKFVIRVPQKGSHDSPDLAKRMVKRNGSDLKLIPPEPKVYLDLLAQEENRNCESESDDTGSTISTVVGLSSIPNTTNSSFSDLRSSASSFCDSTNPSTPTSEPTTPVLDLSRMLSPYEHSDNNEFLFTKLINGKDQDGIGYEEKTSTCADDVVPLQPPLSFQDAPLSYGNEEMRANLTENLDVFQEEPLSNCLKNQEEIVYKAESSPFDGKFKENNPKSAVPSKKPSLIPRLAKSIGLLSPPKPSPRKESTTDGNKSRFNKKKPPPLPPSADGIQNGQGESVEGKTLKSSIPYLKKKKVKSDDSKKNSKTEKKSKSSNAIDDANRGNPILLPNDSGTHNHETEDPKTPEAEGKLTWEVPDLKNSKSGNNFDGDVSSLKNTFGGSEGGEMSISEPEGFLSDLENGEFKTEVGGTCEAHFLFPWSASKHLETIGEDEEDLSVEEDSDRIANGDKKKEDKSPITIVEEMETTNPTKDEDVVEEDAEASAADEGIRLEESKLHDEVDQTEESDERSADDAEKDAALEEPENESEEKKKKEEEEEEGEGVGEREDESEANGPNHKNTLCNNHVLVKLDNDSLEVVKNVGLNASNGEIKEVMVPVVSAIGLAPTPGFTRMPPDGHEVPQNFTEESLSEGSVTATSRDEPRGDACDACDSGLPPLPASEPPSTLPPKCSPLFDGEADRKYFAGRTKPARNSFWRQDEKSEKSVRDKIAMFSSGSDPSESSSTGSGKLSKYKSSDDVFYYEDPDCNRNLQNGKFYSRSILSLDKVSNGGGPFVKKSSFCVSATAPRSLDYSNRTQSSMDLSSSSSSAYSSSCSPDSSLSSNSSYLGYSSTLPRKKTREDNRSEANRKDVGVHRTTSFSVHGRSQSLLDVNPSPYKARHLSESSREETQKPGSLNLLIEQRRKNLSKLRGLVIPEKLSDAVANQPIVDLPEIKSRDLILSSKVPNAFKEKIKTNPNPKWSQGGISESGVPPKVTPTHLWDMQSKTPNIPKYSPAFKRKSISVFGGKEPLYSKKEVHGALQEPAKAPVKPPRNLGGSRQHFSSEDRKYQESVNSSDGESPYAPEKGQRFGDSHRSTDTYVPKRRSTPLGKYRLHGDSGRSEEDSDNDSAVSSSRSSISHGFSPPASPLLDGQYQGVDDSGHRSSLLSSPERSPLIRTLSSDTTVSAVSNTSTLTSGSQASISSNDASSGDANNKRILKPQSVEAINRKNVLASAKYSRGFDAKSGSPLIQRKFLGEAPRDGGGDLGESGLPRASEAYAAIGESFYPARKYSAGSNSPPAKTEVVGKPQGAKIAYITDVEEPTEVVPLKKKLEKSESLPSAPTAAQPAASRKTSVPFGFSWENGNDWDRSSNKQTEASKDNHVPVRSKDPLDASAKVSSAADESAPKSSAAEKDSEFSCLRLKSDKSPVETDSSLSSKHSSGESVVEKIKPNSKVEPRGAQTNADRIPNGGRRSVSVNDIRKAFEKVEASAPAPVAGRLGGVKPGSLTTAYCGVNGNHVRVSSLDSTNSEDSCALVQGQYGFSSNLQREQFGSITSLASSTSLISPQELQLLIEEANQTLEESAGGNAGGSSPNNHDVLVIILHRDTVGGSVGITLAGGADYESKEITVHKVLAGSPADRDGRIQKGDRILSINGKSMKGVTHRESLAILKSPRLEVVLVVSRLKADANLESANADDAVPATVRHSFLSGSSRPPRILEGSALNESDESKPSEIPRGPPVVLSLMKDGAGLGFSLEGGKDCPTGDRPLVVKKIFTGGAAEKCGQLKAGDEIINVNGVDVSVMSRIEVWKLMKQLPDGSVTITVKHEVENRSAVQP